MLTVALVFLVAHSVSPFSLLPSNLMVEAGNNKVPVYYNALNLLRSTVLDTSVYNINITTLIIIVLFNAIMAFTIGKILHDVGRSRDFDDADLASLGCLLTREDDRLSCLESPLDGFALTVMALFFVYILQTFLTTAGTASQRRNSQEEHFFFREFGCLESVSEVDFDMCLQRSACESPDRAMKILETVGPISGRSPKYGNMLTILRQAAGAGLDGQDCSTL